MRRVKSADRVMREADRIMGMFGFSIHDLPDFRWADYDDGEEALIDAIYYWMDYDDIPPSIGDMVLDEIG